MNPWPKPRKYPKNEAFLAWLRGRPCIVCSKPGIAAHLPHVRRHGDLGNAAPVCPKHHDQQHRIGIRTWAMKHGLDLEHEAQDAAQSYEMAGVHNLPW